MMGNMSIRICFFGDSIVNGTGDDACLGVVASSSVWRDEAEAGDGVHPNEGGYSLVAEAIEACSVRRDWIR
jgi:lysophospholipase L1-like esterase